MNYRFSLMVMKGLLRDALCLAALIAVASGGGHHHDKQLVPDLFFNLNGHNLDWPCGSTKNIYESSGRYIPRNIIATRTQIYKDEAIVALPRYKPGVPFTIGVVSLRGKNCRATITPFPCWAIQEEGNCDAIQSAVDIVLDIQVRIIKSTIFFSQLYNNMFEIFFDM